MYYCIVIQRYIMFYTTGRNKLKCFNSNVIIYKTSYIRAMISPKQPYIRQFSEIKLMISQKPFTLDTVRIEDYVNVDYCKREWTQYEFIIAGFQTRQDHQEEARLEETGQTSFLYRGKTMTSDIFIRLWQSRQFIL